MKITVTQFKPETPPEGTLKEGQDYTEHHDETRCPTGDTSFGAIESISQSIVYGWTEPH